jgi:ABC transport system ATP-binding/permease protein
VGRLEMQEEALHGELATHATDYAKVADLDARLKAVSEERARTEEEWLALAEQVDGG